MHYLDVGQIQVITAQPDFSMARVTRSCEAMELGDIMLPFQNVDVPVIPKPRTFSPFMKTKGDMEGFIVMTRAVLENFGSTFRASGKIAGSRSRISRTSKKVSPVPAASFTSISGEARA